MDNPLNRELLVVLLLDICNIEHTSMKQDCFSVLISGLGFVSFLKDLCSTLLLTNQPIFGDFTRLSKYMTLGYPDLQHPPQSCWFFCVGLLDDSIPPSSWWIWKESPGSIGENTHFYLLITFSIFNRSSWQQAIRALVHSQGRDLLLRAFGAAIDMIRALYSGWAFAPCSDCLKKGSNATKSPTPSTEAPWNFWEKKCSNHCNVEICWDTMFILWILVPCPLWRYW